MFFVDAFVGVTEFETSSLVFATHGEGAGAYFSLAASRLSGHIQKNIRLIELTKIQ